MLKKFKSGFAAEVNSIVTADETWLYYFNVTTKSQSKVWVFEDEKVAVQVRKSKSIGKRMVAVFFTKGGILITVSLEKSKTVTAKRYTETYLPQLFENLVSRAGVFGRNGSSTIGKPCIYEVCPESIRPTFISPRHSVQATSAGHERQQ